MAKRQQTKTVLSPLQRKRLLLISLGLVALAVLWVFFAPGRGVYHMQQQKKQLLVLRAQQEDLIQQNKAMAEEIERLQHDKAFLEQVAREEHGMLQDNELVFDFSEEDKKKKKK